MGTEFSFDVYCMCVVMPLFKHYKHPFIVKTLDPGFLFLILIIYWYLQSGLGLIFLDSAGMSAFTNLSR